VINNRHSYRGDFLRDPVPREDLITIMKAGLAAPSGCNKQTTSLICVDDPTLLKKIYAVTGFGIETAPAIICVLTRKIVAWAGKCYNVQDYSAAIENMLLAIIALGYESCWYEGYLTDEDRIGARVAKILHVPDEYELIGILPVGIAERRSVGPKKKEFGERAWFNGFQNREE